MGPTPRQQADALYDAQPPQDRLNHHLYQIAYIGGLDVEQAPILTIRAEPDSDTDIAVDLTITGPELLEELKTLLVARLRKLSSAAATAVRQAGIPEGCTSTEMEFCEGVTVTIVHRPGSPPLASNEAEVVLD
jgi:hypothetical protein